MTSPVFEVVVGSAINIIHQKEIILVSSFEEAYEYAKRLAREYAVDARVMCVRESGEVVVPEKTVQP